MVSRFFEGSLKRGLSSGLPCGDLPISVGSGNNKSRCLCSGHRKVCRSKYLLTFGHGRMDLLVLLKMVSIKLWWIIGTGWIGKFTSEKSGYCRPRAARNRLSPLQLGQISRSHPARSKTLSDIVQTRS
jgi:hypothetical protein